MSHDWPLYRRDSFHLLKNFNILNPICAEIGVFKGHNAVNMLELHPGMKLHLIDDYNNMKKDPHTGTKKDVMKEAKTNLAPFNDRITWVNFPSEVAVKSYPDNFFDYVYIDGDHELGIFRDIWDWYPKVKPGMILAGHDVGMWQVKRAFTDFIDVHHLESWGMLYTASIQSDWWLIKEVPCVNQQKS